MLQLANHSNIALNKETLPLLHPLDGFTSILQASISARNKPGAYIKIFTGALISHNTQNHPMDVVTVAFLCSRQC